MQSQRGEARYGTCNMRVKLSLKFPISAPYARASVVPSDNSFVDIYIYVCVKGIVGVDPFEPYLCEFMG
jgi:hypothetical protein